MMSPETFSNIKARVEQAKRLPRAQLGDALLALAADVPDLIEEIESLRRAGAATADQLQEERSIRARAERSESRALEMLGGANDRADRAEGVASSLAEQLRKVSHEVVEAGGLAAGRKDLLEEIREQLGAEPDETTRAAASRMKARIERLESERPVTASTKKVSRHG